MKLNFHQKAMPEGSLSEAPELVMNLLLYLAESIRAQRMVEVDQVHTDNVFYLGKAGLNFIEKLVVMNARVAVTTTLNASTFDLQRSRQYKVPDILLVQSKRLEKAHLKMGILPTWTCAPHQDGVSPRFGSLIASAESNAIMFANSIANVRTNRVGDLMDICAAITGCFPEYGLYLAENRMAQILVRLDGFSKESLLHMAILCFAIFVICCQYFIYRSHFTLNCHVKCHQNSSTAIEENCAKLESLTFANTNAFSYSNGQSQQMLDGR